MTPRLPQFRTILIFLVLATVFSGCNKSYNFKWVHFDETYCADKWDHNINNERLKDNIVTYLEKKSIKVYEIEIFTDRTPDSCTDCSCKSGRRVKCKVKRGDLKEVKKEGFYE